MYVIWNHIDDKPTTYKGIVLHRTFDQAFRMLVEYGDVLGGDLVDKWYSIEDVSTLKRVKTYGEKLRDYYIGAV